MAAMITTSRILLAVLAIASLAPAGTLAQQDAAPVPAAEGTPLDAASADAPQAEPAPPWVAALEEAETALLSAEFDRARERARAAAREIAALGPESALEGPPREGLAQALEIEAQAQLAEGDQQGATKTLDRLVAFEPGYTVDASVVGKVFADLLVARRGAIVGYLRLVCAPLPCESVIVDGRPRAIDAEGRVALAAGAHAVRLERRGFRSAEIPTLEVRAGETLDVQTELAQVARDLIVRTEPAGVRVTLDGREVGVTEAGEAGASGVSAPLEIREVDPGSRVLVFEAPCRRRVEQRKEVVLDALDPHPLELGTVKLEESRAFLEIVYGGEEGSLVLDGTPVTPGRQSVCPGPHELTLSVAGRAVWFERIDVAEDQQVRVEPRPRPVVALVDAGALRTNDALSGWNVAALDADAAASIAGALDRVRGGREIRFEPKLTRLLLDESAAKSIAAAAPSADLIALVLPGTDRVRASEVVALVSPGAGVAEVTQVRGRPARDVMVAALGTFVPLWTGYTGLDVAPRAGAAPIVAHVAPSSPAAAASLMPGDEILAVAGSPASARALALQLDTLKPDESLSLDISRAGETRKVALVAARTLVAPNPESLGGMLLPSFARASLLRVAGSAGDRVAGAVQSGLVLAALGRDTEAARILDRASVDDLVDSSTDARGTVAWVLSRALERLGDSYANEVRTRMQSFREARLGGRGGPSLGYAAMAPAR